MNMLKMSAANSTRIRKFHKDDRGLSTVEYVIILVLIAAAAIGTWQSFGGKVKEKIGNANTEMEKVKVN